MAGTNVARKPDEDPCRALYDAVGEFLADNRLSFDPVNYAFAYRVLSQPGSPLARQVASVTDGGVRLTARDIEDMGGAVSTDGAGGSAAATAADATSRADGLVARTQLQVEGFADMVDAMRAETRGFGRDLAASADAIGASADDIARMTATMLSRVATAEERLDAATQEASVLREQLEEARGDARTDPLTELPNRRAFMEAFASAASDGAALCLAVCDIDHFKDVNDRFGHAVGDRVLKALGKTLADACDGQLVARYGGEEFAVLFVDKSMAEATAQLDAARERVADKRYRLREDASPLGAVTFSGGLVAVAPGEAIADAFARADGLLYSAKTGGRNQVVARPSVR